MRVEAPVAGAKGLWQRVEALWRSTLPRQARATRAEGNSVWVKFLGDGATDPESKFPSTVAGVPPTTMGWVITLGGRKGLFVATAVPMVHSIAPYSNGGDPLTTTSIDQGDPFWYTPGTGGIAREVTLQPGTWQFDLDASMFIRRNVATGGWQLCLGVGDNRMAPITYQVAPRDQFHLTRFVWRTTISVEAVTVVPIRIGFCGWSTAGTTYGYFPQFTGTYTKIG